MIDKKAANQFYRDVIYGRSRLDEQSAAEYHLSPQALAEIESRCNPRPSPNCRYCGEMVSEADYAVTHSYWRAIMDVSHKACEAKGRADEAYECQLIDADCNDCKHFRRGSRALYRGDKANTEDGEYVRIHVQKDAFHGHCCKLNKPTTAFVNFASGHPCFEHRRD